jgi:hypothetical protein
MGFEADGDGRSAEQASARSQSGQQSTVASMDAVKVADRNDAAGQRSRQIT